MNLRLLNHYEQVTYEALTQVCAISGARVFPKVRLADVFRLQESGITSEQFSFALKAHFDFLVTNADYQPLFSVEYDGSLHRTSPVQQHRDSLKNQLCDRFGHGLLRINSRYLTNKYRGLDLLTYFVDAWFLEEAFTEAQESGIIPYDEPFDVAMILSSGSSDRPTWPYWLSRDVQIAIQRLYRECLIAQMAPSSYVGVDASGNYRCLSWLVVDKRHVVRITTGMRAQHFPAVCKSELVSMLATFDLFEQLKAVLDGREMFAVSHERFFGEELEQFKSKYAMMSACSCSADIERVIAKKS